LPEGGSFTGFPPSAEGTIIPNLFFSRVLPEMDSTAELVVSGYFFFAQGLAHGRRPRFVTQRELAADATLVRSLAKLCGGDGQEALRSGLESAVRRGTLARARVKGGEPGEWAYVVNTPANRRALEEAGGVGAGIEPLPPAEVRPGPDIFSLYEENIGPITPLAAEQLAEAEAGYPAEWIREAFREAVSLNKRNWRYISSILRRWQSEGPDYEKPERDPEAEWLARRYRAGKRPPRGGRP
jgi:DnaD/phage-associated family protein